MKSNPKVPLSIIIPVFNEENNLPHCLHSIRWAEKIYVVDSGSTDRTSQIAKEYGAEFIEFHFNGTWPKKKNWALDTIPFPHEWVFILDADETLPPEAEEEFRKIVTCAHPPYEGYWINRRFFFMGKCLRHSYFPNWNLRLFKHRLGRYEKLTVENTHSGDNEVHEHIALKGKTSYLKSVMNHYAFPSIATFVEKHNRYSNWEARVTLSKTNTHRNLKRRLRWISFLFPTLRFLYIYIWQRGFLDGRHGYYFARLHAFYEFLNNAKTYELKITRPSSG